MHDKDIINILKRVRGETDAPLHRGVLRRIVLSQKREGIAPLQNFITIISMNRYYLSVGTVALLALIAVVVAMSPISPGVVSAQEQVNRAFARAVALTPEMRAQIEAKMKTDMLKTLEEAKAAPDLKIMTKEEYEKEAQFTISQGPNLSVEAGAPVAKTIAFSHAGHAPLEGEEKDVVFSAKLEAGEIHRGFSAGKIMGTPEGVSLPVKYLSYTDPEGRKTVLGLDENDTPVFKFVTLREGDIKHLEDGSIGIEAEQIHMIRVEGTPIAE